MLQKALEMFHEFASVGVGLLVGQIINFGVQQASTLIKIILHKG